MGFERICLRPPWCMDQVYRYTGVNFDHDNPYYNVRARLLQRARTVLVLPGPAGAVPCTHTHTHHAPHAHTRTHIHTHTLTPTTLAKAKT